MDVRAVELKNMVIKYTIETPWWDGEKVGIAERRLVSGATMEIEISYEDKHGNREYPHRYRMACSKMKKYPTYRRKGTLLHIIPIADFGIMEE